MLEITCSSETSQCPSLRFPGMDRCHVSELAEELAQVTCGQLPWSDQRGIALELGVAGGAAHGAVPGPGHISARLHEWLDGYDATACADDAQLRGYVNQLRCA